MNLVVGATGMVGMEICRLMAASGKPVKALVRASSDVAKVESLKRLGAKVATWTWDEGNVIVANADGITDEFQLRQAKLPVAAAPKRPVDPWGSEQRTRKPKSLFDLLFKF